MSKNTFVNTRFWQDNYIADLDPSEKLIFIYLLTCPHITLSGIYEIPLKYIALDTGIDKEMVQKILDRFGEDKKVLYREGWLCVVNYPKYQSFKGEKLERALEKEIMAVPRHILSIFIENGYPIDTLSILSMERDMDMDKERDMDMVDRFDEFWSLYPRKVAKQTAHSAWKKLKPSDALVDRILSDVTTRTGSDMWMREGRRFCPHPATYLNQKRWEDEDVVESVLIIKK